MGEKLGSEPIWNVNDVPGLMQPLFQRAEELKKRGRIGNPRGSVGSMQRFILIFAESPFRDGSRSDLDFCEMR